MTTTKTPPAQLERVKLRNAAVRAATATLIKNHQDEWEALYAQEATRVGVTPRAKRPRQHD